MITILEEKDSDIDVSEKPYCYCFREISIGVWRDTTPENILKSIPKNVSKEEECIWQEELNKAKHFWTIGAGVKGYYKLY